MGSRGDSAAAPPRRPRGVARAPRPAHDAFVIGIHAKSLRANMDPLPLVDAIVEALPDLPGAVLRVDAHTDVMTPGYQRHDAGFAGHLRELAAAGSLDLRVHDYFSDDELWAYLQGLDVSVLPYVFGTHSGWLEACSTSARASWPRLRLLRRAAPLPDVCRVRA